MRAERDAEKDDRKRNRKEDPCERNARESTRKSKSPGSVEHMERKWSEHLLEHKRIFQENTIVGLFRLATEQAPGKAALVTGQVRLTYRELEELSDRIARGLLAEGVQEGEIVAVRTGRTAWSVAAFLGVWKAGCAYVFLDSDQPAYYNSLCMQECGVRHEVTQAFVERVLAGRREECSAGEDPAKVCPAGGEQGPLSGCPGSRGQKPQAGCPGRGGQKPQAGCSESGGQKPQAGCPGRGGQKPQAGCSESGGQKLQAGCPVEGQPARLDRGRFAERGGRDRLAVVVYTSGSTGKPKGVLITQQNLAATVSNFGEIGFSSDDHYGCFASLMFIASVYDIALSLSIGATLYLIPKAIRRNIREVAKFYVEKQITATFLPPHMAMKYMELDEESPLRLLLSGSEPVRNLKRRPYKILNVYASSEASALISYYQVEDSRKAYPIGRVVAALRYYIVDEEGTPVRPGEEGELWISGPQVSIGYCQMPQLTAEHFCPNPFCGGAPYERVFKTGDMVSEEKKDELVYHGRKDNMVKIRGFRVELTGVERHMLEYPGIKEACCRAYTDSGGTNLLFGYYISGEPVDHEDFRAFLGKMLPYYMIPLGLVRCEEFPRTLSGKVDRKAFLPPEGLDDWRQLAERYR